MVVAEPHPGKAPGRSPSILPNPASPDRIICLENRRSGKGDEARGPPHPGRQLTGSRLNHFTNVALLAIGPRWPGLRVGTVGGTGPHTMRAPAGWWPSEPNIHPLRRCPPPQLGSSQFTAQTGDYETTFIRSRVAVCSLHCSSWNRDSGQHRPTRSEAGDTSCMAMAGCGGQAGASCKLGLGSSKWGPSRGLSAHLPAESAQMQKGDPGALSQPGLPPREGKLQYSQPQTEKRIHMGAGPSPQSPPLGSCTVPPPAPPCLSEEACSYSTPSPPQGT